MPGNQACCMQQPVSVSSQQSLAAFIFRTPCEDSCPYPWGDVQHQERVSTSTPTIRGGKGDEEGGGDLKQVRFHQSTIMHCSRAHIQRLHQTHSIKLPACMHLQLCPSPLPPKSTQLAAGCHGGHACQPSRTCTCQHYDQGRHFPCTHHAPMTLGCTSGPPAAAARRLLHARAAAMADSIGKRGLRKQGLQAFSFVMRRIASRHPAGSCWCWLNWLNWFTTVRGE